MAHERIAKIIRVGTSLAFVLPANICRQLKIERGSFVVLRVVDEETLLIRKAKVVDAENTGEQLDPSVPTIKNG